MKEAHKQVAKALCQDTDGMYEIDRTWGQHWSSNEDICRVTPDSVLHKQMGPKSTEAWKEHYLSGQEKAR